MLSHLIFTATRGQVLLLPHFTHKETEAPLQLHHMVKVTELQSDLNPRCTVLELELLNILLKLQYSFLVFTYLWVASLRSTRQTSENLDIKLRFNLS